MPPRTLYGCVGGAGAVVVEANLSCPNVGKGQGALYTDAQQVTMGLGERGGEDGRQLACVESAARSQGWLSFTALLKFLCLHVYRLTTWHGLNCTAMTWLPHSAAP